MTANGAEPGTNAADVCNYGRFSDSSLGQDKALNLPKSGSREIIRKYISGRNHP
jgi:hypothetical protein